MTMRDLPSTKRERIAIVGHARTGSNYLLAGLRTSNSVKMFDEIFAGHSREPGKDFDLIYATLFNQQPQSIKHVGFKLFYYHFTNEEWNKFLKSKCFKIIHLTRRNYLRTLVSLDIAFKTNEWIHTKTEEKTNEKEIHLKPEKVIQRINYIKQQEELCKKRFKDWELIEVVYEDLAGNPELEFKRIGDFLNIPDINISKIHLKKQNPEPVSRLIKNYDEIANVLQATIFSYCLEN